ncbi:MAG TPA: hypothetical protein VFJ96_10600 [Gemmatimonadaceae bacterium]|nr:hypothetical protein [Gemmatimonadaceae bacterium]
MRMPLLAVISVVGVVVAVPVVRAQQPDSARAAAERAERVLPDNIAVDAAEVFNAPAAVRATGRLRIPMGQIVTGDVAVLGGPLSIGGHVTGRVIVINGDVVLDRTALVDGDLIVVGGLVEGQEHAHIGGRVEWYRPALRYHLVGDTVVADPQQANAAEDSWLRRWLRRRERSTSAITLKAGGTYNRVDGLPVMLGPRIVQNTSFGSVRVSAFGIIRSADSFAWKNENLGHDVNAEVRFGRERGIALGGRWFNVVDPVERWQLNNAEVGLAAFVLHRDYRDYYNARGGSGYVSFIANDATTLTLGYGVEQWDPRAARGPFTLFRNSSAWRDNPMLDQGRFHIASAALTIDTRNNTDNPWVGWYITADVEHLSSPEVRLGPTTPPDRPASQSATPVEPVSTMSGFLDVRRYNRVSPKGQLNFRAVLGGWLGGDDLPLQRRLSLGGPGSLPGFDFRVANAGTNVLQCNGDAPPPGMPAECERIALAQVEYRGDLHIRIGGRGDISDADDHGWDFSFNRTGAWVVFADAGRGWLVGSPRIGSLQYTGSSFPALNTFQSDIGIGLDFDIIGLYLAKALSDAHEPPNFFIRLGHRF